jgi:hypothetical protein
MKCTAVYRVDVSISPRYLWLFRNNSYKENEVNGEARVSLHRKISFYIQIHIYRYIPEHVP